MNAKIINILLILALAGTIVGAWWQLNLQSEKHQAELAYAKSITEDAITDKNKAQADFKEKIKAISSRKPLTVQIPVYPEADPSSPILTTFQSKKELVVLNSNEEWAQVISVSGFPVWVREDLVARFGKSRGYVSVSVKAANARSSPNTTDSITLGKLRQGDVLKVSRRQGQWVRVWSPIKFKAWVKMTDLSQ